MSIREHLLARMQPLADRLADDVAAIAEAEIENTIARIGAAFDVALSAVAGDLDAEPAQELEDPPAAAKPPRQAKPRAAATPRAEGSRPACSKCGESGHNARSCGRAPKGRFRQAKEDPAPDDVEPAAPPVKRTKPSAITGGARAILERTRAARAAELDDGSF